MKKITFVILILTLLLLNACSAQPPSILTTDLGAPPDDQYLSTSCVQIFDSAPSDIKPKGTIVLQNYKSTAHLFLMELENGRQTPLETLGGSASDITISPDRKSVAYKVFDSQANSYNVMVSDAQGNVKKNIPWDQGFFIMRDWINNEEILIASNPPMIAFNPYTNEQKGFQISDFPGYSDDPISGNRYMAFDSTMTRGLYKNANGKISLLDMNSKEILAEVGNERAPYATASWSPDDSQIAVVGAIILGTQNADIGYDIFSISRDGKVKQLTHLTDHYGNLLIISPAAGLRWSPDGRFIAFWLANPRNPNYDWQLAVFDTVTQKTTNYCIPSSLSSNLIAIYQLAPPIWSPDGTQILIENRYDVENSRVVILDIAQSLAFKVIDSMYPIGWLPATASP